MQSHVTWTLITGNKCFPEKHDQFDICLFLWSDLWLFILTVVFTLSCPPTMSASLEQSGWVVVYMRAVHSQSLCVRTCVRSQMSLTQEMRASCCWHTKTACLRHFCSLCHCISACLDFRRMHFLSVTINRFVFVFLLFHQHVTRRICWMN